MKLLVLAFDYYPDSSIGSLRTTALIDNLLKMGRQDIKIELITTMPNANRHDAQTAPELEYRDQLKIRRIPISKQTNSLLGQAWGFFCYARQVKKLVRYEKYTVIYASSSRLMMASLAAWLAKKHHSILFLDIRALFVDTLKDVLPTFLSRLITPVLARIEHWTLSGAHHVNVMSKGFEPYIHLRFPTKKLTCYSNGIDNDFLQHGFKSTNQPSEQFTLLYVGNIGEGQGLEYIIPPLAKSLEGCAQIKIIGEGSRKVYLEAAIQTLECTNIEIVPSMQRDMLYQAYMQADVLFLHLNDCTAFRKILPAKIFEYAATGKPILAGVTGYAAEFIHREIPNAVVFHPCDMAHALKEIAKLDFVTQEREEFIKKYQRDSIMQNMANELISYF